MDDDFESSLRRRFALSAPVAVDEGFVAGLRLQRVRQARRALLLRGVFVGVLLLAAAVAIVRLRPWLSAVLHDGAALLGQRIEGPRTLAGAALLLALAGAAVIAAWAWRQAVSRD
jgi:hypothetical protein